MSRKSKLGIKILKHSRIGGRIEEYIIQNGILFADKSDNFH